MKKILNILKPVVRGAVKSIPVGNTILEVVNKIKDPKKHSWVSIATQIICIIAIVYAFVSHTITLDSLLSYFGWANGQ